MKIRILRQQKGLSQENIAFELGISQKALKLEHLTRDDFSPMSNCKTCPSFNTCRLYTGVCWSNVASAYGEENWDFPSPSCPYSPTLKYSMFHE